MVKIGIIGLSVHSEDFTKIINGTGKSTAYRVTTLYHPTENPDVAFSDDQLRKFSETIQNHDVRLVDSIPAVLEDCDAVMLLTNDGRPHFEQILPVLKARKPVYIDKPMAESLENVVRIFRESQKYGAPVFTSSALRYTRNAQLLSKGEVAGAIIGAETHGPAPLQKSHTDLFWDGIHGIELLFTVMGTGCRQVSRVLSKDADLVTGVWEDGRTGIFRGLKTGRIGFGGTVFGEKAIAEIGAFDGYEGLVEAILSFFKTGNPPVSPKETLELYAFMHAADISKNKSGQPVRFDVPDL